MSGEELELAKAGTALAIAGGQLADASKMLLARARVIKQVREEVMSEGIHYGAIPGVKKPSLWKPGAEILAHTFGLYVELEVVESTVTDDEATYRVKATAYNREGERVATCNRVCSTRERKYRWTYANKAQYDAAAPDRRNVTKDGDLQVRADVGSVENTIVAMADKRAFVGVIALATGADEQFGLEIEEHDRIDTADKARKKARKQPKAKAEAVAPPPVQKVEPKAPVIEASTGPVPASAPVGKPGAEKIDSVSKVKVDLGEGPVEMLKVGAGGIDWLTNSKTLATAAKSMMEAGKPAILLGDPTSDPKIRMLTEITS